MIGGIKGCELSIAQLLQLMEDVRGRCSSQCLSLFLPSSLMLDDLGGPISVDKLRIDDLKAGVVKSSWLPKVSHPAIPPEQADALAGMLLAGMSLGISCGALNVGDEFNQLFSDYEFTQPHEFLLKSWHGKP